MKNASGVFITATDTDAGKTLVSAWLALKTNSCYYKPIQCGMPTDSNQVQQLAKQAKVNIPVAPESYLLQAPLSPHKAAAKAGVNIDIGKIIADYQQLAHNHSSIVVEGAGGVMVPLNQQQTMLDLIKALDLTVLLIARGTVGTINHTWLTMLALQAHGITPAGIIISGELVAENDLELTRYTGLPILAHLPQQRIVDGRLLAQQPLPHSVRQANLFSL